MADARMRGAAVVTDGKVGCAALLWRYRGQPQLTVVVKAEFAISHGGVARYVGPVSIADADVTFGRNPARSVETASDLAPYKPRCDVTLIGHACAPAGRQVEALSVRLGLAREGRPILDKVVSVVGDRAQGQPRQPFTRMRLSYERALGGPGETNPVGSDAPNLLHAVDPATPVGLGPVSPFWPARKALLAPAQLRAVSAVVPDVPEGLPWDYYQSAPADQRVDPLWGGEQLVLDGVHPTLPRVETWIPIVRAAARVVERRDPRAERPIDLLCDTLAIDADAQRFTLVWRGRVEGFSDAGELLVAAGLASPAAPVDWARVLAAPAPPAPMLEVPVLPPPIDGTVALAETGADGPASLPFSPALRAPERAGEGTVGMADADHAALKQRPIAPFEVAVPRPTPLGALAPGLPWSPAGSPAPPARPAAAPPEAPAPPATEHDDPLAAQLRAAGASSEEIAELLAALSLPKP